MEKQWRSIEELKGGTEQQGEKLLEKKHDNAVLDVLDGKAVEASASRRDFLKLFGFSFATAAVVSSCEKPVQKAIPYLIQPEDVTPGKASYYASTFYDGSEFCSVLVKVRDGRPIKIEGNHQSPLSLGGTSARVQASVLNLYDDARFREPLSGGKQSSWDDADAKIMARLAEGGSTVLLTPTVIGPASREVIRRFTADTGARWIQYDEVSASGIRIAHGRVFGSEVIPGMDFSKASYILSFGADFLGTWISPVEFARGYSENREVSGGQANMSKHVQVEANLSMTGSNADERIAVSTAESTLMIAAIYNTLAAGHGLQPVSAPPCTVDVSELLEGLGSNTGSSLVVSGSNDPEVQMMVAGINYMLGNYGPVLDLKRHILLKQGKDEEFYALLEELEGGMVQNLLIAGVNPAYSAGIQELISKVPFSVYLGDAPNETASACKMVCPDHHYLEAWGDAEAVSGSYSLQQPCIHPIFNTRAWQDSLLLWGGRTRTFEDFLPFFWENNIAPSDAGLAGDRNDSGGSGSSYGESSWWLRTLQTGHFVKDVSEGNLQAEFMAPDLKLDPLAGEMELCLYTTVALNEGRYANNPWLQELPDPVSMVCWDNYLSVSPADAENMGFEDEDVVSIEGVEMPVLIQPGQAKGTLSLALGYGRTVAGKVGDDLGINAFQWVAKASGIRSYVKTGVKPEKSRGTYPLARTQTHHSMEDRPIVRETSLEEYRKDPSSGNHFHLESEAHHQTLYPEAKFDGFHWGLSVDLNKCTGCNNCVVSCTVENNVAVVGKEEVRKRRIMHWLRIDRYYSGSAENPRVYRQPVMCQHCDNAPCENVCPVSATMHSNEGLNQVAYIRCIGTKYCINNCPYRVRRFNWFKYLNNEEFDFNMNSDLSRLVLNPDVTVRERGVVEKCSLCVQRIQEKKLEAKLENRTLKDGEIQPACVQSCPSGALVFGNLNDPESRASKLKKQERNYHLLEQLHTLPSVGYLTKVRNTAAPEDHDAGHDGHGGDHDAGHDGQGGDHGHDGEHG